MLSYNEVGTDGTQGSGIINIVMKAKLPIGRWNGGLRFTDRQNTFNSSQFGGNVNFQSPKFIWHMNAIVGQRNAFFSNTTENTFSKQNITQKNTVTTPLHTAILGGLRTNAIFNITPDQTFTFGIGAFHNQRRNNGMNNNFFVAGNNNENKDASYAVSNKQDRFLIAGGGNFKYNLKIGKKVQP